jgi:hypothetical protein
MVGGGPTCSPSATASSRTEAWGRLPFDELLVVRDEGRSLATARLDVSGSSLGDVIRSGVTLPSGVGAAGWLHLGGPSSALQPLCREGLNLRRNINGVSVVHARLGVFGNNEDDCRTPDSMIGLGLGLSCTDGSVVAAGSIANGRGTPTVCAPQTLTVYGRLRDETHLSPAADCAAHLRLGRTRSGLYRLDDGVVARCEQEADGGGWTRIHNFDVLAGDPCPAGLSAVTVAHGPKACEMSGSALQVPFSVTPPRPWEELRVTVVAFQFGPIDAFASTAGSPQIDDSYVDGISLTVGQPRQHLFTWAVGMNDLRGSTQAGRCPCAGGADAPGFVDNFRCESGSNVDSPRGVWFITDPLFDGFELNASSPTCASEQSGAPAIIGRPPALSPTAPLDFRMLRTDTDENIGLTRLIIEAR